MRIDQHELGPILYTQGNKHICEGVVCDNKKSILWDEIDSLFLDGWKLSVNFIPSGETVSVRIISKTYGKIIFKQSKSQQRLYLLKKRSL